MEFPVRKGIRLENYDYSRRGAYFITICTKDKMCIFWDNNDKYKPITADVNGSSYENDTPNVGTANGRPQHTHKIHLSEFGVYVKECLNNIHCHYPMVFVDKYVIMPNHIHLILRIDSLSDLEASGRPMAVPTISTVINQFKGAVSRMAGFNVWQGRFHDRILRNEREYRGAWQYIENNPIQWENDEYFIKE